MEIFEISLITQHYQKTLMECQDESNDVKLELLEETAKVLQMVNKRGLIYGKIRPEGICITSEKKILLKYMHWLLFEKQFVEIFSKIAGPSNEYLSPELILLRDCALENKDIGFMSSSVYIFGLIFLKVFSCDLPFIKFDCMGQDALEYIYGISGMETVNIVFSDQIIAFMKSCRVTYASKQWLLKGGVLRK
jgi:hypothetical protein